MKMEEKKIYETPDAEFVELDDENDIVAASSPCDNPNSGYSSEWHND